MSERNTWAIEDGRGLFGRSGDNINDIHLGGDYRGALSGAACGSRCCDCFGTWTYTDAFFGSRGICNIKA